MALFLYLLEQPNYTGLNWEQYIQTILQYNTQQIYKQVILNIQQQKELEIQNNEFQRIIKRQNNQKLHIKDSKISGSVDMQMIGLNNLAKVEGIKTVAENNSQVEFWAVTDEYSTEMCQSMNGLKFYINKENEFDRYWGENKKELKLVRVRIKGLVPGINLPPIIYHWHWCRSTIRYLPPVEKEQDNYYNAESEVVEEAKRKVKSLIYNSSVIDFEKLPLQYKNKFMLGLKKSEKNTKIILSQESKKVDYIVTTEGKSLYNNFLNIIKINTQKGSSTLAHELFHKIDEKYRISKSNQIEKCLKEDLEDITLNREDIINKVKQIDLMAFTTNNLGKIIFKEEYRGLSDIINGYSKGNIKLGYGHTKEYWKKDNHLSKETFAQFGRMYYENDSKVIDTLGKLLPNTKKYIDNNIKKVVRKYV